MRRRFWCRRLKRKSYRGTYKILGRIRVLLITSALTLFVIVFLACWSAYDTASRITPFPDSEELFDDDGFPEVNWDYWTTINPDIIGWVTVPGTSIDSPLVLAPKENPQFYLDHDVYRNWNWLGCPYLDADCTEFGLESMNNVIFGHNTGWDTEMFADFALFSDPSYAENHRGILLQTPTEKNKLTVVAIDIVSGQEQSKQTQFATLADFYKWYKERYDSCQLLLDQPFPVNRLYTFATCSYNNWIDERTLIYAKTH